MKCSKCKKEVEELFTNDKWEQVCRECLHNEIYKNRQRIRKYRWKNGTNKSNKKYKREKI